MGFHFGLGRGAARLGAVWAVGAAVGLAAAGEWRDEPPVVLPRVLEIAQLRESGVCSAWMSNGARVHIRPMPIGTGVVSITLTFMGGELLELESNRGVSRVGAMAWDRAMGDLPVDVSVGSPPDGIQVRIVGTAAELTAAAPAIARRMAAPEIGATDIEEAQTRVARGNGREVRGGRAVLGDQLVQLVFPKGEHRVRPLTGEQAARIDAATAREWLTRHVRQQPLEIGIAGDVTVAGGLTLAAALLGELPERARVAQDTLAAERSLPQAVGPFTRAVVGTTPSGKAQVLAGFMGVEGSRTAEFRILRAASRVLDHRVQRRLVDAGLTSGNAGSGAAVIYSPYPGFGMVLLSTMVEPEDAESARDILNDEIDRLTAEGPSDAELVEVGAALAAETRASENDPKFWSALLSRQTMSGLDPDRVVGGTKFYLALPAQTVRQTLERMWTRETRIGLIVKPESGAKREAESPRPDLPKPE